MPVSFNPLNQPNTNLGDNPLADTTDIFGLRKATQSGPAPAPKPPTVTPFGILGGDNEKQNAFFQGGARFKENMTTDSIGFREKELALLKERVASGLAGGPDISRYIVNGMSATDAQKKLKEDQAKRNQATATVGQGLNFNPGMGMNMRIQDMMTQAQINRATEAEMAARVDAYIETLNVTDLDDETRKEFLEMYQSGAQAAEISGGLKRAVEGVGKYGARKANIASREAALLNTATNKRQGVL